jgi:hypothetical protein
VRLLRVLLSTCGGSPMPGPISAAPDRPLMIYFHGHQGTELPKYWLTD